MLSVRMKDGILPLVWTTPAMNPVASPRSGKTSRATGPMTGVSIQSRTLPSIQTPMKDRSMEPRSITMEGPRENSMRVTNCRSVAVRLTGERKRFV